MLDYKVARSMCLSPVLSAIHKAGIKTGEISYLIGMDQPRVLEIALGHGPEATLEEAAMLAALVGMELSVVPERAGVAAFTEFDGHRIERADMGGYARRIVEMTEKVADFCVDLRLATGLPTGAFERNFGVDGGFMTKIADSERAPSTDLHEMYRYLSAFGATLASFPKTSQYTNYYRALMATARSEPSVRPAVRLARPA
ncbi:hypothetical protein HFO56_02415 [Rhizobium laguerreae]|uniref:hypothetical protein n=1 Tax=Rhizobium laguerreae TaxID=1076926 RepID=UPI001C90354C|nr:hypothetical protein [Rhizobium laguerreae]MBY3151238.1 hypothetical protein [Rhizobium laguerreae]